MKINLGVELFFGLVMKIRDFGKFNCIFKVCKIGPY